MSTTPPSAPTASSSSKPTEPVAQPSDSERPAATSEPAPGTPAAPAPAEPAEPSSGVADGSQDPDSGKPTAEAAKWRVKLREEEAAHEATRQLLTRLRCEVLDKRLQNEGVSSELMIAAGHDINSLWEDGELNVSELSLVLSETRKKFNLRSGRLGYDPNQGTGPTRASSSENVTWGDAIGTVLSH